MDIIDPKLLDQVSALAVLSPRRRRHHNFHHADGDLCHRLLNAMEPDSYIPPHCHADTNKDETILVLRGRFGVVEFSPAGEITRHFQMSLAGNLGVTIPHGVWHSLVCLESGSVFFETKAGPYSPLTAAERAVWAPSEQDAAAPAYLEKLRQLFVGTDY